MSTTYYPNNFSTSQKRDAEAELTTLRTNSLVQDNMFVGLPFDNPSTEPAWVPLEIATVEAKPTANIGELPTTSFTISQTERIPRMDSNTPTTVYNRGQNM